MYEIWLAMNIVYEIALTVWPLIAVALVAWIVLMGLAWGRLSCAACKPALGIGALAAVLAFLLIPGATRSSLGNLGYWVDWANLGAIALGAGAVVAAFVLPLWALVRPSRRG